MGLLRDPGLAARASVIRPHLAIAAFALTPVFAGDAACLEYAKPGTTVTGYLLRLEFRVPTPTGESAPQTIWQVRRIEPFCVVAGKVPGNLPMQGASMVELVAGADFEAVLPSKVSSFRRTALTTTRASP